MAKLRVLSGREVCRILGKNGFVEVRQRGSHVVMQRKIETGSITVPVPDHSELKNWYAAFHHPAKWAATQ